jgi:hypothetical protein
MGAVQSMGLEVTTLVQAAAASAADPPPLPESPPLEPPPLSPGSPPIGAPELLAPDDEAPELPSPAPVLLLAPDDDAPLLPLETPPSPNPASGFAGAAVEPQPIAQQDRAAIPPTVTTRRATSKNLERRIMMPILHASCFRVRCHAPSCAA